MVRLTGALSLAVLVAACGGPPHPDEAVAPAPADPGAMLYRTYCVACHLVNGAAVPNLRPALAGSALVNGDPAPLAAWVMYGTMPPDRAPGLYPPVMPHYHRLSDAELAALLTHLRDHFGNNAGAVDAASIATVRARGH